MIELLSIFNALVSLYILYVFIKSHLFIEEYKELKLSPKSRIASIDIENYNIRKFGGAYLVSYKEKPLFEVTEEILNSLIDKPREQMKENILQSIK